MPPGPHVEERRQEQEPADDDERDDPVDRVEAREVDGQHLGDRDREEGDGAQAERAAAIPEAEPHRDEGVERPQDRQSGAAGLGRLVRPQPLDRREPDLRAQVPEEQEPGGQAAQGAEARPRPLPQPGQHGGDPCVEPAEHDEQEGGQEPDVEDGGPELGKEPRPSRRVPDRGRAED